MSALKVKSLELQGDEEDHLTLQGAGIEVYTTKLQIYPDIKDKTKAFFVYYHNCVSLGLLEDGVFIMISDVIKNEKYERNPNFEEEEFDTDHNFEAVKNNRNEIFELLGEYTLTLKGLEQREELYRALNLCSQNYADPPELKELLDDGLGDDMIEDVQDFSGFQGGNLWADFLSKNPNLASSSQDLGKRELQGEMDIEEFQSQKKEKK